MSVRNPRAKWVLPLVVNPPTHTDWCVPVPDDPFHRAAFLGALQNLGAAYLWQDDPAHTAKAAAKVWRDIIDNLVKCMEPTPIAGIEQGDFMPLRVDCDCNVFVTCCDGTEKQILTSEQVQAAIQGSSQNGAPQPQPGGGCQIYKGSLIAGQLQLLPTVVNSGDTIQIVSADGATTEDNVGWQCPFDGGAYFAGSCLAIFGHDASSFIPATARGKLILYIDGVYYDPVGVFTVPGGIVNKTPMLVLNYDPAFSQSGTITYEVEVCNNSLAEYTHVFDFKTGPHGFVFQGDLNGPLPLGQIVAGIGMVFTSGHRGSDAVAGIHAVLTHAAFTMHSQKMRYSYQIGNMDSPPSQTGISLISDVGVVFSKTAAATTSAPNQLESDTVSQSGVTVLDIAGRCDDTAGSVLPGNLVVTSLEITGPGTDPFIGL
jgi:hypothetical protein